MFDKNVARYLSRSESATVDPEIFVLPTQNQVDNLIEEIKNTNEKLEEQLLE